MKVRALAGASLIVLVAAASDRACGPADPPRPAAPKRAAVSPAVATPDRFMTSVRPILVSRCSPCHEPGGKMYGKMPFDQPSVVASHEAGVLRRLQGSDRESVEKWLATLPPAAAGR